MLEKIKSYIGLRNKLNPSFVWMLLAGLSLMSLSAEKGKHINEVIMHGNLKRKCIIYVPSMAGKMSPMPVLFALHGRGANAKGMMLLTRKGFNKLADRDGFLVVYPNGIDLSWNDGRMDSEANDRAHLENIDDVGYIAALIDLLVARYDADPGRIYVTGISNGAMMAYRLGCELSHRIAVIAPVDGSLPYLLAGDCMPAEPVSVLAINNVHDPLIPFNGGEIYSRHRKLKLGKVIPVEETLRYWVNRNGCNKEPEISRLPDTDPGDSTRVIMEHYGTGINGSEVIHYAIEGGGHTWPGGIQYLPKRRIGKTSRDINANEVIWSFCKQHGKKSISGNGHAPAKSLQP